MLAKCLDKLGFHVFAGCLDSDSDGSRSLKTHGSQRMHVFTLDVTRDQSVNQAIKELGDSLAARGKSIEFVPMT